MKFIKNKKFISLSFIAIVLFSSMLLAGTNIIAEIDGHPWGTIKIFHGLLLNLF